MRLEIDTVKQLTGALIVVCGVGAAGASLVAQGPPPVLLVLDQSAIDYGDESHLIPAGTANEAIASVGLREPLPYFAARTGESVTIPGATNGTDGWFAVRSVPASWATGDGSDDGLENFFVAGGGLGSPDENGDRVSLLGHVPGVVPLRAAGLNMLFRRQVCAVVYNGHIAPPDSTSATNLAGVNLGVVAFQVTGLGNSGTQWPTVTVQVLDARQACKGALAAMSDAPNVE